MLENYSWQFFDIMWLVLLLSQINTVCHCRFTVTAPRSQEAWSKNQRRRSFKPWSSLALSSVHKNEETMLQNWLCNWKLDYVFAFVSMDMLSLAGLPTPIVCSLPHCWLKHTQTRWCQLLSLKWVLSRLARTWGLVRIVSVFPSFTCQAQQKENRILKCAKAVSDSPFLTPILLHRGLGTSMEENLGL